MKRLLLIGILTGAAAVLLWTGCGSAPKEAKQAPKPEVKPAEPVTGLTGLFEMYKVARSWAPDLQILEVKSVFLEGKPAETGKAHAWTAVFYSPSKNVARTFSYAVEEISQTMHEGVRPGGDQPYNPVTAKTKPFLINAVRKDTTEAYQVALEKSKDYAAKFPNLPITFVLERPSQYENPAWRVVWGTSVGTSNHSVYIDASTGLYLQTMR